MILVPILAAMAAAAPLANDPIMSGRSIRSFRHPDHQNPSIISDSIGRARMAMKTGKKVRRRRSRKSYSYRRGLD